MEQTFFNWIETHMPVVGFFTALTALAVWGTILIVEHKNRIVRLEEDSKKSKKDMKSLRKSLKKDVARLDQKVDHLDKKVDHLGAKVDRLITYLTATKTVDFKD